MTTAGPVAILRSSGGAADRVVPHRQETIGHGARAYLAEPAGSGRAGTRRVGVNVRDPIRGSWLARRRWPLLAAVCLIVEGMCQTIWWAPAAFGKTTWWLPGDLWGTLVAASRLGHLHLAGLYTAPTGLVSFPGTALILVPATAVINAAGLSLHTPGAQNPHPGTWLIAGPYMIAISAVALFAADALAEWLGVTGWRRFLLAAGGAVALWNVSARWGHPEDAVAVGLLLYGMLALAGGRPGRCGWLVGAGIAVQPLVLLALPVLAAAVHRRRLPGFLTGAAVPSIVLLGAAAAANWNATFEAVAHQPNWPTVDHPTPWMFLAPHAAHGAVSAGPARALTVLFACGLAVATSRRWRAARADGWTPADLADLLWWVTAVLALRSVFEPVMVSYYVWPPLAAALVVASRSWQRQAVTTGTAILVTFLAQATWRNEWAWWTPVVVTLALTLLAARYQLPWTSTQRHGMPPAQAAEAAPVHAG